jgi:cell wall-associated NlpC family hydrolase
MQFKTFFTILIFLFTGVLFSQKTIKHKVSEGESFYSIAKKYKITEADIYKLNPSVKGSVLQLKTVLLIPNKNFKVEEKKKKETKIDVENADFHIVNTGETLYQISKIYGISIGKLTALNPNINPKSLKIGDKIIISANKNEVVEKQVVQVEISESNTNAEEVLSEVCEDELGNSIHTVQKGETLFSIAKKYKIKLKKIKELNEEVIENLPEGYQLIIKAGTLELSKLETQTNEKVDLPPLSLENMSKAEFLIAKSKQHIGTRYRGGGTTSAGFDCSGLMFATFKHINMTLPRSSGSMAVGAGFKIEKSQGQKGDLIFFSTNGRGYINHVGMITEVLENEIKFIHSSVQAGVIISSTKEPYYAKRFVQINRVLE